MADAVLTIAVDFDAVIVRPTPEWKPPYEFMPFALEGIRSLRAAGWRVMIHSARASNPDKTVLKQMIDFLDDQGVPYDDVWKGPGKPIAEYYLDDRALTFDPRGISGMNWSQIASRFGEDA